jgi:Uma2 family endonuclease
MAQPMLRPSHGGWTVDDLLELPEGNKYEIIDGSLHVSPMADPEHHRIADRIMIMLDSAAPPGWLAIREVGVSIPDGYFGPDVSVLRPGAPMNVLAVDPVHVALVVEVESRGSRRADRFIKPPLYAEAGVEYYWRIERTDDGPVAHIHRRSGPDGYVLEHSVVADESLVVETPYKVTIAPGTRR